MECQVFPDRETSLWKIREYRGSLKRTVDKSDDIDDREYRDDVTEAEDHLRSDDASSPEISLVPSKRRGEMKT